jgi:hypothetical protein
MVDLQHVNELYTRLLWMNQLLTCILPQTIYLLWDHADLPMTPQHVFYDWPIHREYHSGIYPRPAITLQRIVPQTCVLLTCTCTRGCARWYQTCFTLETILRAFPPHIGQRFLRRLPCTNIPSHATAHGSPNALRMTCSPTTPWTRWNQTSQVTE